MRCMLDAVVLAGKKPTTPAQPFVQTAFLEDQDVHPHFPMAHSAHTCVRRCPQGRNYQHNILSSIRHGRKGSSLGPHGP